MKIIHLLLLLDHRVETPTTTIRDRHTVHNTRKDHHETTRATCGNEMRILKDDTIYGMQSINPPLLVEAS
jgi:hypothetical protein